jgi:Reprolysin (M12B) family zinc metalloprotease
MRHLRALFLWTALVGAGIARGKEVCLGVFFILVGAKRGDVREIKETCMEIQDIFGGRMYGKWRLRVVLEGVTRARYDESETKEFVEECLQSDDSSYSLDTLKSPGQMRRAAEGIRQKKKLRYFRYFVGKLRGARREMRRATEIIVVFYEANGTIDGMSFFNGIFTGENLGVVNIDRKDTVRKRAEIIAHEMAHIMGSNHDGDSNSCEPTGSIMEAYKTPGEMKLLSKCTVEYIRAKIESNADRFAKGRCKFFGENEAQARRVGARGGSGLRLSKDKVRAVHDASRDLLSGNIYNGG